MSKKLVAFFTGSGQTKTAATKISQLLKCDIYEIKPKIKYTTKDLIGMLQILVQQLNVKTEIVDQN